VQVHYDEGIANHIAPEPCAGIREGVGEASAGNVQASVNAGSKFPRCAEVKFPTFRW
jgi:hypothetical protein